ncbi:MAG: hypothetical protein JXR96_02550 [Deltaproteobacteria bacterium]|nr:hypothetical protein [Deltaproteobacteria bacterium]
MGAVIACSDANGDADAGVTDGMDGGDVDPCQAAAPLWNEVWQVQVEETDLEGRTPQINLMDVWGAAADDVYAVGFNGTILHYNGQVWEQMDSGTQEDLEGVWGFVRTNSETGEITRKEVFAAGSSGTILRYDGNSWQTQLVIADPDLDNPDPQEVLDNFHDIWGMPARGDNPATDHPYVVAVGGNGVIVQFDPVDVRFTEVRHAEQSEYMVRDENGDVVRDGEGNPITAFRTIYVRPTTERLGGVFGASNEGNYFFVAVGNNATILEHSSSPDPATWQRTCALDDMACRWLLPASYTSLLASFGDTLPHFNGVWGRGAWEIFVVGLDGLYLMRRNDAYTKCVERGEDRSGPACVLPANYLRGTWNFYQSHCGEIPDGGTEAERGNTSWVFFVGWGGTLLAAHDGIICPLSLDTDVRIEGIWGAQPRGESERIIDGGTEENPLYACDPIDVFVTGVNGTILHLSDPEGR